MPWWRYFLVLIIGLGLVACTHSKRDPQELVVALEEYPNQLDPRFARGAYNVKIAKLLFNGLLKYDQNLKLVPDLAEKYEFLSDQTLRITLKKGIHFHDGTELKIDDVLFTFQSVLKARQNSPAYQDFSKIKSLEKIDDYTLVVQLKEPYAPFLTALILGIVPHLADQQSSFKDHPIGTGPFKFLQQQSERFILLEKNPDYFAGPAHLSRVRIRTIKDETTRVLELIKGNIDLIQNAVPPNWLPWLTKHYPFQVLHDKSINYQYLGFNLRDPILSNVKVRWAIAYLLDIDNLIQFKLKGYAQPATGILSPIHWAYNQKLLGFHYDLEKANALLDDAGFPDPPGEAPRFKLTYKTSTNASSVDMALAIKELFHRAHIEVEVKPYDWGIFYKDIRTGNFQLFSLLWVGVTDPDIFYQVFASQQIPPNGSNRGFYANSQVDELAKLAQKTYDPDRRKSYYDPLQEIVANELPYVSLWHPDNIVVLQKDLKGYYLTPNASFEGLVSVYRE